VGQTVILADKIYQSDLPRSALPAMRVVLTRFNLVLEGFREVGGIAEDAAFVAWLERRIQLFQTICLRSLSMQSLLPDAWLLGFDAERREAVAPVLDAIAPYPWIIPVWQEVRNGRHMNARGLFADAIASLVKPGCEWIISSRVDNDDGLSRIFVEAAADYAAAVVAARPTINDFWLSFPLGAQFSEGNLRLMPQNNNAFLTRVERVGALPGGKVGTVLQGNHGHVFAKPDVFTAMTRYPMWLQVVHGTNVSNRMNERLQVLADPEIELRRFGLKKRALDRCSPPKSD